MATIRMHCDGATVVAPDGAEGRDRGRDPLDLLLLRRRLRRHHRARRRRASPACAAIPSIRPTSASCAARAARCTSLRSRRRSGIARRIRSCGRRATCRCGRRELGRRRSTTLADRFAACIATHGPDSVAFYVSGQLLTEDYYVFNKLAKGLVGTNNIDTNSRLCMSSAVTGYKATLGADAPPACYEDIDHADLIFIAGSNTAWAHPVLFRRIEAAKERNPALKIIVVDPRRTATADFADLHLAIEPGTDVALFHGMLHVLLWEDWIDAAYIARAHVGLRGAEEALVREYTPAAVAAHLRHPGGRSRARRRAGSARRRRCCRSTARASTSRRRERRRTRR